MPSLEKRCDYAIDRADTKREKFTPQLSPPQNNILFLDNLLLEYCASVLFLSHCKQFYSTVYIHAIHFFLKDVNLIHAKISILAEKMQSMLPIAMYKLDIPTLILACN